MQTDFTHESAWRGPAVLERMEQTSITVCGLGLLGSLLADNLARQGARLMTLVDFDRVESHNLSQLYRVDDVGRRKVDVMVDNLYGLNRVQALGRPVLVDATNRVKTLRGSQLVLDCFDNMAGRMNLADYAAATQTPCLHLGLSSDGYGEAVWNDEWRKTTSLADLTETTRPACEIPLARNLALLVVAVGTEMVWDWLEGKRPETCQITLRDKRIMVKYR